MNRIASLVASVLVVGCVRDARPAKFADRPIVRVTDDRRPIAEPETNGYYSRSNLSDVMVFDPIIDTFDRPRRMPARDVNALDEVPDSTWFTNRIGVREMTPEEVAAGPNVVGAPQLPLHIVDAKPGGANPGFIAKDARGTKFIIKFDPATNPEQQTSTDPIVGRLLWTLGYNTPDEYVVFFRRDELTLSPELVQKRGIRDADIDGMLKAAARRGDQFRASASAFLAGKPKGGWDETGTRDDDPNDRVPHEHRRVLRGLKVFAAWLNHTDMKEDNSLDMYVGEPGRGHLVHYLVDFGEAFGGQQSEKNNPQIGYEYGWDYGNQFKALFAFGLWKRPFEYQHQTQWPALGYFGTGTFDPTMWRERYPYAPFKMAERQDIYWATKLLMRFDRAHIEAVVAKGELSDPAAARFLVDTLMKRRDAIGRAFLDYATPLEGIKLTADTLCGIDIAREVRAASSGILVVEGGEQKAVADDGAVCVGIPTSPGYHVAKLKIQRRSHTTPTLEVHYVGGPTPRIVGLVR